MLLLLPTALLLGNEGVREKGQVTRCLLNPPPTDFSIFLTSTLSSQEPRIHC